MQDFFLQIDIWIKSLVSNPYFGFGGFLIGILGVVISYYIAHRDRREKVLLCVITTTKIISKSKSLFSKLSILYDGCDLETFSISTIRIKNLGTEVIKPDDIAKIDPIEFGIKPNETAKLLDFGITYVSDVKNNFSFSKIDENNIKLNFEYIEPKDYAIFQLLHTGDDSKSIDARGTVIGAKKPFSTLDFDEKLRKSVPFAGVLKSPKRLLLFSVVIMIFLFAFLASIFYFSSSNLIISSLCLFPLLLFLIILIRALVAFSKGDADSEFLSNMIQSTANKIMGVQVDKFD